ncbi:MAG: SMC-Scp complex subunit ScpB [Bdellovibrionaceae bacterium]|nr:SMC-Scp complex subunit ScpB [Bdellovibrionales bacterium]MCB9083750.1 SMC-Scp complex subunit ScpB [Pseudobdellovibrionaceae bacterium]
MGEAQMDVEIEEEEHLAAADSDDWAQFEEEAARLAGENPVADEEMLAAADEERVFDELEDSEENHFSAEGTELEGYESEDVEDAEFIEDDQLVSIVESVLFSTDKPMSVAHMKQAFKGTKVKAKQIRRALDLLAVEYAGANRGVTLEEVNGGYQLRTKMDNMTYLRRMVKARPFKLSGPALEVIAIAAYKQPVTKSEIDSIRGVESGHLLRGLMEKGLVNFAGKSDLPGKPMLYATTRKFLEIFGLRNIRELPSLTEIDELIPEGIGEVEEKKEKLEDITGDLSMQVADSYSEGEEELLKISSQLETITTSSDFFEDEKRRQKEKRDRERAEDIRDALAVGEEVDPKDAKWLARYEKALEEKAAAASSAAEAATAPASETSETTEAEDVKEISETKEAGTRTLEEEVDQAFEALVSSQGEEIDSIDGFGTVADMEAAADARDEARLKAEPGAEEVPSHDFMDEETVTQTFAAADLSFEGEDEALSSGAKIGEVSFGKLEKDMEIFDEEQFVEEEISQEPEPSAEV